MTQNKRHKHADLIHAWADGAEIQWKGCDSDKWIDCYPKWLNGTEYRIKPKTKTVRFRNYIDSTDNVAVTYTGSTETYNHFKKWLGDWQELEIEDND